MKVGAAWYGFGDQTPTNYFEMAAALGLKYVEVPLYSFSLDEWYATHESVGAVRDAALDAGVKIVSGVAAHNIAGRIRNGEIDTDGVDLGQAQARRTLEIAGFLGVEVVRLAEPQRLLLFRQPRGGPLPGGPAQPLKSHRVPASSRPQLPDPGGGLRPRLQVVVGQPAPAGT